MQPPEDGPDSASDSASGSGSGSGASAGRVAFVAEREQGGQQRAEKKGEGLEKAPMLADRTSFAMMRAASQAEAKQLTEPHQGRENFGAADDAVGRGARVLPDQRSLVEIEESDQPTSTLLVECPARMLNMRGP